MFFSFTFKILQISQKSIVLFVGSKITTQTGCNVKFVYVGIIFQVVARTKKNIYHLDASCVTLIRFLFLL